ncbi:hypothetical protein N7G274_000799 [Stereocaulon virgatum]|uniref:Sde2 N-terminal ubiquitin domain-containing protein n=1 Tax=Stereocaulon virgatum TaxID=373712 RepID=A0ABR4AMQ7_9LECA
MTAHVVNVFLTSFPGLGVPATLALPLDGSTPIADLRQQLSQRLPDLNTRLILTTTSNKVINFSEAPVSSLLSSDHDTFLPLRLSVPLCGGKGGFGSQLRAAGGRMSSRKKNNQGDSNNSNRNLDGRRLRTVNEAKALAEYLALKPVMEKREKEARRKRWEQVVALTERREEDVRNGSKGKVDGKWVEDKEDAGERAREAVIAAMRSGDYYDNLKAASSGSSGDGPGKPNEESQDEEMEEPTPNQIITLSASKPTPAPTRTYLGFDEDDEFLSEDEDGEVAKGDEGVAAKVTWGKDKRRTLA